MPRSLLAFVSKQKSDALQQLLKLHQRIISSLDKNVKSTLSLHQIRDILEHASAVVHEIGSTIANCKDGSKLPRKELIAKCKAVMNTLDVAHHKMKDDVKKVASLPSLGYVHDRNKVLRVTSRGAPVHRSYARLLAAVLSTLGTDRLKYLISTIVTLIEIGSWIPII